MRRCSELVLFACTQLHFIMSQTDRQILWHHIRGGEVCFLSVKFATSLLALLTGDTIYSQIKKCTALFKIEKWFLWVSFIKTFKIKQRIDFTLTGTIRIGICVGIAKTQSGRQSKRSKQCGAFHYQAPSDYLINVFCMLITVSCII